MKPNQFNLRGGLITQWEPGLISDAVDVRREDMVQIDFGKHVVDVGWYEARRRYVILVVEDSNWDAPVWSSSCELPAEVSHLLQAAIDAAASLSAR